MENTPKLAAARPWKDFLRVKRFVRPYAWRLVAMAVFSLAGSALGLAQPHLSKYLVDGALMRRDLDALFYSSVLMFGATVFGFGITYAPGLRYMRLSASHKTALLAEADYVLHLENGRVASTGLAMEGAA